MREDLDFLFQKAMRSKDLNFMIEVQELLVENNWNLDADELTSRMLGFMRIRHYIQDENFSKFRFLLEDSQLGQDWYL